MFMVRLKAHVLCGVLPRMPALQLWNISSSKDPKEMALDLAKASFMVREGFIFIVFPPFSLTVLSERNSLCRFAWKFYRGFMISHIRELASISNCMEPLLLIMSGLWLRIE